MTQTELRERIANGEHSGVEFTSDVIEKRRLAEELVAFANLRGGHVLLGVDDSGSVLGLTKIDSSAGTDDEDDGKRGYQRLDEWVMQTCRDKIRPEIVPYFEIFRDVEPGRDVAAVQVERGWSVHHVWHNQRRTYCIRVGSVSREASAEELARLFQQRGAFRPELRPVSGTSIADLDRRRLEDYFGQVREQHMPASTPSDDWRRRRRRGPGTKTRRAGGRSSTFGNRSGAPRGKPNGLRSSSTPSFSTTARGGRRRSPGCCSSAAVPAGISRRPRSMRLRISGRKRTTTPGSAARCAGRSSG